MAVTSLRLLFSPNPKQRTTPSWKRIGRSGYFLTSSRNAGPAVVETAERRQRNATQVCLHAYRVVPRLWLSAVVPSVDKRADLVAETYANVVWEASTLKTLLYSGRARAA
jgi:hypothetical protein